KNITEKIDFIGIGRATTLARTEVIRAHHLANINEYRQYGVELAGVKAEWRTVGDDRVCELCAPNDGKIYALDEIEPLIPLHPNCRCMAVPIVGEVGKEV
ncbi:MAG: phage head morphogenesis protein, partial [archaeon]|nr:phage head morphogenesis protein [archaeon]